MLTRRQALVGAAAAGVTALVRGGTDVFAVPLPSTAVNFEVPRGRPTATGTSLDMRAAIDTFRPVATGSNRPGSKTWRRSIERSTSTGSC